MTLTASEISAMRGTVDDYLPDTCVIQRATTTQDSMGGISQSWATLASGVSCRLDEPKTGAPEGVVNQAVGSAVRYVLRLKYDQAVTIKDRVVHGSLTYEVQEVTDASSWLMSKRVIVIRVE